jgi:hypothetical protein
MCPLGCSSAQDVDCKKADGEACNGNGECASGVCARFIVDADGDGFGDLNGQARDLCGRTPPPNFSTNGNDCCDTDRNANPNQQGVFDKPDACGSFDYNCNGCVGGFFGAEEPCAAKHDFKVDDLEILKGFCDAPEALDPADLGVPNCGRNIPILRCNITTAPNCLCEVAQNTGHVLRCR